MALNRDAADRYELAITTILLQITRPMKPLVADFLTIFTIRATLIVNRAALT
jgi:hypothetical protein